MNFRHLIITALLIGQSVYAFCQQQPPPEFFNGLKVYSSDKEVAKKDFLIAIQKDSLYHGSYHFLGVIYLLEQKPDSAIWCFRKSLLYNTGNVNHTKEMTYVRLIDTYTFQKNFKDAFDLGWEALQLYPDSRSLRSALKDMCLWSFYIDDDHLPREYLSADLRDEYVVNSIDEEYLILRNLSINGEYLQMRSQALVNKKSGPYDVFRCVLSETKKEVEVDFKINWDMNKYFGGKTEPPQPVIDDPGKPVYERVGAMLISDNKTDVQAAINKLTH